MESWFDREEFTVDNLLAIWEAASGLHIDAPDIINNLDRIGNACQNLKHNVCCTDNMPLSAFREFLETPKPKLLKMCLFTFGDVGTQVMDDIFEVLAEKVSTLENFEYGGPVPPFVAANPNLKTASITLKFSGGSICPCR